MSRHARPVRLAIDGLAAEIRSMRIGGFYAVLADHPEAQTALVVPTIVDALLARQPVLLITGRWPPTLLDALRDAGLDPAAQVSQGRLRLLKPVADAAAKLQRLGTVQLLDELDHYKVTAGGLIIGAPGDLLFAAPDASAGGRGAKLIPQWLATVDSACLAVLENPDQALITEAGFDGVARLRQLEPGTLHWVTDYWQIRRGESISSDYRLGIGRDGRLAIERHVATGDAEADRRALDSIDADRVIATEGVVRGERRVPSHWELVDNLPTLLARSAGASAATCILATGAPEQFRELARTVHTLRQRHGPLLRIVIYEVGSRLRRAQEQLLLSVGANAVVVGAGVDRLLGVLLALQGQRYSHGVPADFDAGFADALPAANFGYLAPAAFCEAAPETLRRAADLSLDCTLVRLSRRDRVAVLDALAAFRITRHGDYLTASGDTLWLFLFSCQELDAEFVLARLCTQPVGELFGAIETWSQRDRIERELQRLREDIDREPGEDHRARLDARRLAERQALAQPEANLFPPARHVLPAPLTLKPR